MKQEWLWIGFAAVLAAAVGVALGFGVAAEVLIISILFLPLFAWMGQKLADDDDAHVLPLLLPAAYLAKIVGAGARYLVLPVALRWGRRLGRLPQRRARLRRHSPVPGDPDTSGVRVGFGTIVTRLITAGVYTMYSPETLLGGFIIFSIICFAGQLLFYWRCATWSPASDVSGSDSASSSFPRWSSGRRASVRTPSWCSGSGWRPSV